MATDEGQSRHKRRREGNEELAAKKRQRQLDLVTSASHKLNSVIATNKSQSPEMQTSKSREEHMERKKAKRARKAARRAEVEKRSASPKRSTSPSKKIKKRKDVALKPSWTLSASTGGRFGARDPQFVYKDDTEYLVMTRGDRVQALSVNENTLVDGLDYEDETLPDDLIGDAIDFRVLDGGNLVAILHSRLIRIGKRNNSNDYTWAEWALKDVAKCFDVRRIETKKKGGQELDVAIGFADGKIHVYSNVLALLSTSEVLASPRILHWHRDAVQTVKYTPDSYLISGGKETTLVIWQLDTGECSFLPNLTATIERIVVNPSGNRYAVQLGDNSIMVLSSTELKPVAYLSGLQMAVGLKVAALLHPTRKNELLITAPATRPIDETDPITRPFLQTSVAGSSSVRQALTRNNVTDYNVSPDKIPIISPDVALIAVSADGQWLASVDEWLPPADDLDDDTERREVYLKFWQWDASSSQWQLNSRIDGPHEKGSVFSLLCLPSNFGFVTAGQDSKVKTWTPKRRAHGLQWTCRMAANLDADMDSESDPIDATLAVSDDGSLIAAALLSRETVNDTIHFVDTRTGVIRTGNANIAAPGLIDLAFYDGYLIALSTKTLRIWNVVEDVLHYTVGIPADDGHIPLLAINKLDNVAVVASPDPTGTGSILTTCQLNPSAVQFRHSTEREVVSVLANPHDRGFLVIYENATTSTYTSTLPAVKSAADDVEAANEADSVVAIPDPAALRKPLPTSQSVLRKGSSAETPMLEDDRRVVRPEEIAKIFDDATTLPSIKEMFHAVAGLYGRKPRAVAAAA